MFIWNKNKHFNKVTEDLFNRSMADIRELNVILTPFGTKPYIENDKEFFVLNTFLYLLFFQEGALRKKYSAKYEYEVAVVLDVLIYQIADRFHHSPQKVKEGYLKLRKVLSALSEDEEIAKVGLYYGPAFSYLHTTFSGEYNPENVGIYDGRVEYTVANFFQRAMRDNMRYLGVSLFEIK